mmetsp:Transcript_11826/g.16566  ORF Transcript_11826/g.16566 Transcript_11826/m.16566 type:complete len:306 (+) Transcript_11826:282-1199(+)
MAKKRVRSQKAPSVFSAVHALESQDEKVKRQRQTTSKTDLAKSKAAKSQTKINGHLMECRILLQRTMAATKDNNDDDKGNSVDACNDLLANLLEARKKLLGLDDTAANSDDDEEEENSQDYKELVKSADKKDLEDVLQTEYEVCREQWKEVLDRRHKDLRLHAGLTAKAQFRVMDSSFWQQVDSTVSHQELQHPDKSNFDDSKVYQHMLQDFLTQAANGAGAEEAARQRLSRATKKTTTKKVVDRRASKGRKIRYQVHQKLVNFTFPVSRLQSNSTGMDEDEWFRSLFGGAANKSNVQRSQVLDT